MLGALPRERDREAAALAGRGDRRAHLPEAHGDVVRLAPAAPPAPGVERDRRQRALADDHRVHELDRDVARVGAGAR